MLFFKSWIKKGLKKWKKNEFLFECDTEHIWNNHFKSLWKSSLTALFLSRDVTEGTRKQVWLWGGLVWMRGRDWWLGGVRQTAPVFRPTPPLSLITSALWALICASNCSRALLRMLRISALNAIVDTPKEKCVSIEPYSNVVLILFWADRHPFWLVVFLLYHSGWVLNVMLFSCHIIIFAISEGKITV